MCVHDQIRSGTGWMVDGGWWVLCMMRRRTYCVSFLRQFAGSRIESESESERQESQSIHTTHTHR